MSGVDVRTVLLIDDTDYVRHALRAALEADGGWSLTGEAADGQSAAELAAEQCPDVIVLDQQMPTLTGLEVAPLLRRSCPGARIVMWSSDPAVAERAAAAGVDAFVDKSEPLEVLIAAMRV